jgi:hypothetical protein
VRQGGWRCAGPAQQRRGGVAPALIMLPVAASSSLSSLGSLGSLSSTWSMAVSKLRSFFSRPRWCSRSPPSSSTRGVSICERMRRRARFLVHT